MSTTTKRKTTTEKGLGWRHRQAVEQLKRKHQDASPCDWCGNSMYLEDTRNWDYDPDKPGSGHLQADHGNMTRAAAIRAGVPIPLPDRLLHKTCNQQRGDGVNDHLAIANRTTNSVSSNQLTMTWPWR